MNRLILGLLAASLALVIGTPAAVAKSPKEGALTALAVDWRNGRAETVWYLTGNGQKPVRVRPPQGSISNLLNGRRAALDNGELKLLGKSNPRLPVLSGSVPWVTLLLASPGGTGFFSPEKQAYLRDLFLGKTYPSLPSFWEDVSQGKMNLGGSAVFGPFEMPRTLGSYYADGLDESWQFVLDAVAAAGTAVDFKNFYGIRLVLAEDVGCACATVGNTWSLGGEKFYAITWLPPWSWSANGLGQFGPAHEDGHGLGFMHSGGTNGMTYQNKTDLMSGYICGIDRDPTYGCVGQQPIGRDRSQAGWIDKIVIDPGSTRRTMLDRARILELNVKDKNYTVEARFNANSFDQRLTPGDGVYIHEIVPGRTPEEVWLVNSGHPDDGRGGNGKWSAGERFERDGVTVCVESWKKEGFQVAVGNNIAPDCRIFRIYLPSIFSFR